MVPRRKDQKIEKTLCLFLTFTYIIRRRIYFLREIVEHTRLTKGRDTVISDEVSKGKRRRGKSKRNPCGERRRREIGEISWEIEKMGEIVRELNIWRNRLKEERRYPKESMEYSLRWTLFLFLSSSPSFADFGTRFLPEMGIIVFKKIRKIALASKYLHIFHFVVRKRTENAKILW